MFNILITKDISESPLWKEQIKSRIALNEANQNVWLETNLFSPVWWFMIVVFIVMWFIWWKLVDKTRLLEIFAYGLMVAVYSTVLDTIATQNVLWGYPNRLTPLSPPLLFEDFCILPVIFMFLYQYSTSWKPFIIALFITTFLLAFVAEPIAVWLDIFQLNKWKYTYSFPSYIILGLSTKWVMNKIKSKQNNSRLN